MASFAGSDISHPSQFTVDGDASVSSIAVLNGGLALTGHVSSSGSITASDAALTVAAGATVVAAGQVMAGGSSGGVTVRGTLLVGGGSLGNQSDSGRPSVLTVDGPGALLEASGALFLGLVNATIGNGATVVADLTANGDLGGVLDLVAGGSLLGILRLGERLTLSAQAATVGTLGADILLQGVFDQGFSTGSAPLLVTGSITDQISVNNGTTFGPKPLLVSGTAILSHANNSYAGGTSAYGNLTLAGRAAAGTGAVSLLSPQATLSIAAGASGGPDGRTTVVAGTGSDTVNVTDTSVLAYGGAGALTVYNGSAASTVYGGGGVTTLFGGSGGGLFVGGAGGVNVIVGGSAPVTILGGGSGDQLYAGAVGGSLLAAGSGNATLSAGGSSGDNVLFGGGGSDVFSAGSGKDLVVAGAGASTVFAGGGSTAVFAGAGVDVIVGASGAGYVQVGSGVAITFAGPGAQVIAAINGQAGGYASINGFRPGIDHIALRGYAASPTMTTDAGGTVLTLSDNTRLNLVGITQVTPSIFQ